MSDGAKRREWELGDNLVMLLIVMMALATCTAGKAWDSHTKTECLKAGHAPEACGVR